MSETATAVAPPAAAPTAPNAGAPPPAATTSATLTSVPAGADWANSFKSEEVKSYITQKGFKTPESLAESYKNLEAKLSTKIPEDKMIVLPEKMEGDSARAVFERLGAPKEAKGYEIPRDEKTDVKFVETVEGIFHKNNLTKSQALGVVAEWNTLIQNQNQAKMEAEKNALTQATVALQAEWGGQYEANMNIARQGAKILGLNVEDVNLIASVKGPEHVFRTFQKLGAAVGESQFVDGQSGATGTTQMTPEQAQAEIKQLINDRKFAKQLSKGDVEANARWTKLNQAAAPGQKQLG